MTKPLKITGDLGLAPIFIPRLLEYLEEGKGCKLGHTTNHNTVVFTICNNGVEQEYTCHAYETKTMIVMEWRKQNDRTNFDRTNKL
jgi:hypothetical protein